MESPSGSALAGVDSDLCRRAFCGWTARSVALVAALASLVTPLSAQGPGRPIQISGVRSINFGNVFPGIPQTILRTDPLNSGELDLRASSGSQVELTFTLPPVMTGPAGATMPLSFSGDDAGFSGSQSVASQVGFDPRVPFVATMGGPPGRAAVFLGGTVTPLASQPGGSYTGTITLTVAYLP